MKKTTKLRPQLHAYLGLDDDGNISLFVSADKLNPIGSRLEKGKPLPVAIGRSYDSSDLDYAANDLRDLQKYFDKEASGKR